MIPSSAKVLSHDEALQHAQRGTRQFLLARGCVLASGFLMTVILTRGLEPADYGIYGVVISLVLWLKMLMHAGVPGAIAKLMAEGRHDHGEIERSSRALLVGLSILVLAVGWFIAPQVASSMRIPNGAVLFRVAIIDLPFAAIFTWYDGILTGHRQFGILAAIHLVYGMTKLAGVVALIGLGFSIERVLVILVLSTCVVCVGLTIRYRPRGIRPKGLIMREIAVITAPIALYLVTGQVLVNLDLWALQSLWEGAGDVVGHYVASVNLAKTLMLIPGAQSGVLFASVAWAVTSGNTARAQEHIQDATRFAVIIAAAAWVILGLNATEVLSVLFSSSYAEGRRFLWLQLTGFGLFALLDAYAHALMAAGRQGFAAAALVATVPLVWISNYLLIPWLGPQGAAISMLLGTAISAVMTGAMAYYRFGSLVKPIMLLRVLCAAGVVALVSAAIHPEGSLVLAKLALLGAVYLFVLYMLGEITRKDFGFSAKRSADPAV
jgi:O-antigen/teichoic acid export membrane protein